MYSKGCAAMVYKYQMNSRKKTKSQKYKSHNVLNYFSSCERYSRKLLKMPAESAMDMFLYKCFKYQNIFKCHKFSYMNINKCLNSMG